MKNSLTKLFVTVLSIVLLIGAVAGITVLAEDAETAYDIKSINIIHDEKSIVLIAVDLPSDTALTEAPDLKVSYTFDGETLDAKFHSYQYIEKYGKYYPCYYTVGIAPVDIAEKVVAVAYKTDAIADEAKAKSMSLAEYLYLRLYRDDIISATEGDDADRRGMYLALLEYGSYAQKVFHNNKPENAEDQRTLANELIYVTAKGATVNGADGVLLDKSADVTFAGAPAAPAEYKLAGWQVTTYDGEGNVIETALLDSSTYTAAKTAVIFPTYAKAWEDFEDGASSVYGDSVNKCTTSYETEEGNTFFHTAKTVAADDYIYIPKNVIDYADGNCLVFETKLRINHDTETEFIVRIRMGGYVGTELLYMGNRDSNDRTKISVQEGSVSKTFPGIKTNEWFDLRIECNVDESNQITSSNIYVNGVYVGTNTTAVSPSAFDRITVQSNINVSGGVDFDNTYFGEGKMKSAEEVSAIDFENSTVASAGGAVIGSTVTVTPNATSSVSIAGDDDKYLSFAVSGGANNVTIRPMFPKESGADKFVFEADVRMDNHALFNFFGNDTTAPQSRFYFYKDGTTTRLALGSEMGGKAPYTGVNAGDWFKLKIEQQGANVKVYINGNLLTEATSTRDSANITAVQVYTFSQATGTIDFDDIKAGFTK